MQYVEKFALLYADGGEDLHLDLVFFFPQDIISVDPCHKFTWCLDACIREKNVDIKRSRELQVCSQNIFHVF
jgi:hypothetical protein